MLNNLTAYVIPLAKNIWYLKKLSLTILFRTGVHNLLHAYLSETLKYNIWLKTQMIKVREL